MYKVLARDYQSLGTGHTPELCCVPMQFKLGLLETSKTLDDLSAERHLNGVYMIPFNMTFMPVRVHPSSARVALYSF